MLFVWELCCGIEVEIVVSEVYWIGDLYMCEICNVNEIGGNDGDL